MFYLKTSEVAEALGVCPRTICNWIDSGKLPGFRIPGSLHRRVTEEEVWKFIGKHNIPAEGLLLVLNKRISSMTPTLKQTTPIISRIEGDNPFI
ncbi:MAG: Polar-differentiation response regulator DivK [Pseudomonadota bacterium]|jgi:excisionase family DNA binding protein